MSLEQQMEAVSRRFEELAHRLNQPETAADPACFRRLMQEYHEAEPAVAAYRALKTERDHLAQAKALLTGEGPLEPDFKQMIQQEICEKTKSVAELEHSLKLLLLPRDEYDGRSVIMEVRSGVGGEEAALFAHSLVRMYSMYAQARRWQMELLSLSETELGGVREAVFAVNGQGAYSRLKFESGVHRVQRVPDTETQGRIHTSTATVAVLPQAAEVEVQLDMKDLRIDTFRSSGAGGQHINKTSSAIRITHLPTGMVVECQNERSQFQNKDKALEILRSRLLAQKKAEQQNAINAGRQAQVGTGDRSEKIRTYNFPQDRCTDHRIGLTVHNLDKIMDGGLDQVLDALVLHEQAGASGARVLAEVPAPIQPPTGRRCATANRCGSATRSRSAARTTRAGADPLCSNRPTSCLAHRRHRHCACRDLVRASGRAAGGAGGRRLWRVALCVAWGRAFPRHPGAGMPLSAPPPIPARRPFALAGEEVAPA